MKEVFRKRMAASGLQQGHVTMKIEVGDYQNKNQPALPGVSVTTANRIKLSAADSWASRRFGLERDNSKATRDKYSYGRGKTSMPTHRVYNLHLIGMSLPSQEQLQDMLAWFDKQNIKYEIL